MKYKFIFLIILVCTIFYATPVFADTDIGGGGEVYNKPCSTKRPNTCYYVQLPLGDTGKSSRLYGIRISVVDEYGNRISGTRSFDYVLKKEHITTLSKANFTFFTKGKYTRNEVLAGKAQGKLSNQKFYDKDTMKVLDDLPVFIGIGDNNVLVNYLNSKRDSEYGWQQLESFLNDCNYDYKKYDVKEMEKHSLLIEPLAYIKVSKYWWVNNPDRVEIVNYIGTATEVAKMFQMDGIYMSEVVFGTYYPLAIHVRDYQNPEGQGPWLKERAGLKSVTDLIKSEKAKAEKNNKELDLSQYMLTNYGLAAGHYWVRDMIKEKEKEHCEVYPNDLPKCCDYVDKNGNQPNKNNPQCNKTTTCNPPTVSCPDNCNNNTSGNIKDVTDWNNCIFNKNDYKKFENQYCSIYCREDIEYYFPNGNMTVSAGNHFTVGDSWKTPNWAPVHFVGRSECRTQQIKWSQFESDWDAANRNVASKWDNYQIAIKKQSLIDSASRSSSRNCDYYCDSNIWAGGQYFSCCKKTEKKWLECKTGSKNECVKHDLLTGQCLERKNTCVGGYSDTEYICTEKDTPYDHGYTYTSGSTTYKRYDGSTTTIGPISWCSTSSTPSAGVSSARSAYQSAVSRRESLENDIYQCNNWVRSYDEFSPNVQVGYTEAYYGGLFNLEKTLEQRTQSQYYVNNNTTPSINSYKVTGSKAEYECKTEGQPCTLTGTMTYPKNDWLKQYTTKEYDYYLPTNTYRYILKPSGESTSTKPTSSNNYIDIGYGNLPIHYSRPEGSYKIYLTFTSFGNNNKYNQYIQNKKCANQYNCQYFVDNDIIGPEPNPEGVDVIFRIVSLTNPFPGKDGNGRTPGSNWDSDSIKLYITNNRNLKDPERIYFDREPMYEINLTPTIIRQIRSYNRIQSLYDRGGYADFNLDCQVGTGRQCTSKFIREEFKNIFVSNRCGMSTNWNRCTEIDNGVK